MTIHPPKRILISNGLGLNTVKEIVHINKKVAISKEVWGHIDNLWREGGVVIADEGYVWITEWVMGRSYVATKFLDTDGRLIGVYCDICRPVEKIGGEYLFEDLYLDIWQEAGHEPMLLDVDELALAVQAGYVTSEEADESLRQASALLSNMIKDNKLFDFNI